MQRRKERARSILSVISDPEPNTADHEGELKKKLRISRTDTNKVLIDMLREDAQRNEEIMKTFFMNAEQDRKERKERWEYERVREDREYALRQHQLDLQFAELEER